ncbi:MAG TPA: hypothetical protein VHK69_13095, partial [Chitinophagaceae bacterium]|nr:hypothetical protein [Chitinophagaceae bacterium]
MMRKLIFSLALLLSFGASAQQFGGFPPSTRWKQIHTDTARVIFDAASGAAGRRVSTLIHRMAADTSNHLGAALRKVPVVLHSRTTLANGYVALAPFRSEFYLIPGSNIFEFGALPWSEQLAIHEYRHVHQYNQFRVGLSRVAYYLLGQEGQAVANGAAVPAWFFEGDAVHAETVLTPQGRGRMPLFLNGYNSLWQAGRHYRVMKLLNGSYKDYVPNHYQFGYFMVNYGNLRYGNTFWPKVTRDAAAFRGLIFPFSQAVRRYSGQRIRPFYREALRYYEGQRREKDT